MNTNIGMSFLDLSQEEKEKKINKIVPSICSAYCCRENCDGCFIQELTDETFKNKEWKWHFVGGWGHDSKKSEGKI